MIHMRKVLLLCVSLFYNNVPASVIYSYQGENFEIIDGDVFDSGMSVTGRFEMPSALAPGLDRSIIVPDAFSFSNSVVDISSELGTFQDDFTVSTDAEGKLVGWSILLQDELPVVVGDSNNSILLINNGPDTVDFTQVLTCIAGSSGCTDREAQATAISESLGTWAVSTVPVPATVWLFVSGLLGMVSMAKVKGVRFIKH